MKKYTFILVGFLITTTIILGAGCKKSDKAADQPSPEEIAALEIPTSSTKFPETNLEYYLQSYRDHVLPTSIKVDKKKLKAVIVATGEDQADKKPITVNLYTDLKWNDGKEHIFYIEEVKDKKSNYYGQFSSVINTLANEAQSLKNGKIIGDWWVLKSLKVNK